MDLLRVRNVATAGLALLLLFIMSCNNQRTEKEQTVSPKGQLTSVDGIYVDSSEMISNYRPWYPRGCNFDTVYNNPNTPELARRIFRGSNWTSPDDEGIWFLDSLASNNPINRSFYFKVVTTMKTGVDGAFSEAFCMKATEYVEKNTFQFLSYFDAHDCFPEKDLETWASIVAGEYAIIEGSTETRAALNKLYAAFRKDCKQCTTQQSDRMERFIKLIEEELW